MKCPVMTKMFYVPWSLAAWDNKEKRIKQKNIALQGQDIMPSFAMFLYFFDEF